MPVCPIHHFGGSPFIKLGQHPPYPKLQRIKRECMGSQTLHGLSKVLSNWISVWGMAWMNDNLQDATCHPKISVGFFGIFLR